MKSIKEKLRDWIPPILLRKLKIVSIDRATFKGDYDSWKQASSQCTGYDIDHILTKVLDATLKVKNGDAAYERDSILFDEIQYSWPVLSGLMFASARNKGELRVLDFGGSLGSTYFQNKKFLTKLPLVEWGIVEQDNFVEAGLQYVEDETLCFFKTIRECVEYRKPNTVLLSSALQYLEDPMEILREISLLDINTIIIDRTSFSLSEISKIVVQNVPSEIYSASYPMHILTQTDVLNSLGEGWEVLESFPSPEGFVTSDRGHQFLFKTLILVAN